MDEELTALLAAKRWRVGRLDRPLLQYAGKPGLGTMPGVQISILLKNQPVASSPGITRYLA
jgi:hypothetical protein